MRNFFAKYCYNSNMSENNLSLKNTISQLASLLESVDLAISSLDLAHDEKKLLADEDQMSSPDFWLDSQKAEAHSKQTAELRRYVSNWQELRSDLQTTLELAQLESGEEASSQFAGLLKDLQARSNEALVAVKLSGEFDRSNAILQISAGVGGTDAQDWAQMLQEMYIKYANTHGLSVDILDTSYGEEAGIKSTTLRISGPFAYGKLKAEKGTHRLVRLSPFNSDNLRQTSFALVDTVPEIAQAEVKLDEKDLRIDVYRAGGNGGQSVNTTDSAVRITHLPTGTTVAIQNERSQLKNKAVAMSVLFARLSELAREQKLKDVAELRGNVRSADWGSQIRSYVLHPYTKVKDHRTGYETSDTSAVLGGEIEPFIQAYLDQNIAK